MVVDPQNKIWVQKYPSVFDSFYSFNQQKEDYGWIGQEEK